METKDNLTIIGTALALINSMILSGENHSDQSTKIFYEAQKAFSEIEEALRAEQGEKTTCYSLGTQFTPVEQSKLSAEEILKQYYSVDTWEPNFDGIIEAMESYHAQFKELPEEELRKELVKYEKFITEKDQVKFNSDDLKRIHEYLKNR